MKILWRCGMAILVLFALDTVCLAQKAVTLPSGKSITVITAVPIQVGQDGPALMMKYDTGTPVTDTQALGLEADEIWAGLVIDVEKGHFKSVVLNAMGPTDGTIVQHGQSYNFIFRWVNGNWRKLDLKSGDDAKMTEDMARNVICRVDAAVRYDQMNAVLLYLGDSWTNTIIQANTDAPATQSRIEFVTTTARAFSRTKDYKLDRKITGITLSDDGKSAIVNSDEVESFTVGGKPTQLTERSVDTVGIEGESLVLLKSTSTLLP